MASPFAASSGGKATHPKRSYYPKSGALATERVLGRWSQSHVTAARSRMLLNKVLDEYRGQQIPTATQTISKCKEKLSSRSKKQMLPDEEQRKAKLCAPLAVQLRTEG